MRRILIFIGSFLLLVSSLWANRIFLDELEVLSGDWTQLGKDLIAARDETVVPALSGDGRTLVQAVTRQVVDDDGVVNARGSLIIYRREGMGWVQVGEPIEDTAQQPITYWLTSPMTAPGSRIELAIIF